MLRQPQYFNVRFAEGTRADDLESLAPAARQPHAEQEATDAGGKSLGYAIAFNGALR